MVEKKDFIKMEKRKDGGGKRMINDVDKLLRRGKRIKIGDEDKKGIEIRMKEDREILENIEKWIDKEWI